MNTLERILMFAIVAILLMTGLGCDHFHTADDLRNAKSTDPAAYFTDDRLRTETLSACSNGTPTQQREWSALQACRTARKVDNAKRAGWKP